MAQDTSNDVSWAAAALYFFNLSCTRPSVYVVDVVVVVVVVELAVTSERGNHHKSCDLLRVGSNNL